MSFITLSSLSLFSSIYRKSLPVPLCGGMGVGFFWAKLQIFPLIRGQLQQNSMTERVNLLLFEEISAPHDTEYSH